MVNQIIKTNVPKDYLFELLDKISIKNDKYYIFNKISYKKAYYLNCLEPFCTNLIEYYFESKRYYLSRKHTYNSILTIIRQICKNNSIHYTSNIKYDKSSYEIVYYIYHS